MSLEAGLADALLFRTLANLALDAPTVDDVDALGTGLGNLARCLVGEEDLASVPASADAGTPDDGESHVVVLVAQHRIAGVQRHAHREVGELTSKLQLCVDGRRESICGVGEDGDDAVALALFLRVHTTVCGDAPFEDLVVPRHERRHLTRRGLPRLRRPLDVGEQEGDHPGRE